MESHSLIRALRQEILLARQRIYQIGQVTPLELIELGGNEPKIYVKREDLSPIHAYKWRGAYNRMAQLSQDELLLGVVTASAGNHAQGVALAAAKLGTYATIFMPLSTPRMKQVAVRQHGGDRVDIRLCGDSYDAASSAAHAFATLHRCSYIHAYDDLAVMAGQGTLADEVVMSGQGPFDFAFLQVGGGGMAAATASWLKLQYPDIRIIGVEGCEQASMAAAIQAGHPVELSRVDVFCDGTAVRKVGELTHQVCAEVVDEWMTVTNDEVAAAIQFLWEQLRCIPEPSGAMGIAAILKRKAQLQGQRVLSVLCGANMDFEQLASVARRAAVGAVRRRFLRIQIKEKSGAMFELLNALPADVNIVEFQYGKTDTKQASPVIGFEVTEAAYHQLSEALRLAGFNFLEVTSQADVAFHLIHYESKLLHLPYFISLEFHERPGALAEFLESVSPHANLCYFNYVYSGERVGRALLGFEFASLEQHQNFKTVLDSARPAYRSYKPVSDQVLQRILS